MKTNKSFGEFMLNVWATILRVLFARYCVKSLILKSNTDAKLYLPGAKKELRLIKKLGFTAEELRQRFWSLETRISLLQEQNDALLSDITTECEFDTVLGHGDVDLIVRAIRVYTPSRGKMLSILKQYHIEHLSTFALKVPSAFEALSVAEILDMVEGKTCDVKSHRWYIAKEVAKNKSAWALKFMNELMRVCPQHLGEEGKNLMVYFFELAYEAREDISTFMPYLSVFFPDLYAKVRENHKSYGDFSSFFVVMFPQLLQYLKKDVISSLYEISLSGVQQPAQDVYAWLRIGYERLNDERIYRCMLKHLSQIRTYAVSRVFVALLEKMVSQASEFSSLVALYPFVCEPKTTQAEGFEKDIYRDTLSVLRETLQDRLIRKVEKGGKIYGYSLSFVFPFTDWKQKRAERAIAAMVKNNDFPVQRLNELSSELRKVAIQEMENKSQIDAIKNYERISELVSSTSLCAEAERLLLQLEHPDCSYDTTKKEYIKKGTLKGSTFQWLLSVPSKLQLYQVESYITLYAETNGLSEEQYCMLMQSKLSFVAPYMSQYVRKGNGRDSSGR